MKTKSENIRQFVRKRYAKIAKLGTSCCDSSLCCGVESIAHKISRKIGYTEREIEAVPDGSNLGLGCGNPVALASLKKGEIVLDLGSGAGFDCFLASRKVGKSGRVIGVDMTPEMIEKARKNAEKGHYRNVEFRLGEIENLPVADNSVDVIISNCVINLSTDKRRVFEEAYRVLKPGGRVMISDMVLSKKLPYRIKNSVELYSSCLSGAILKERYLELLKEAGFDDLKIVDETSFPASYIVSDSDLKAMIKKLNFSSKQVERVANSILSVKVHGIKPGKMERRIK